MKPVMNKEPQRAFGGILTVKAKIMIEKSPIRGETSVKKGVSRHEQRTQKSVWRDFGLKSKNHDKYILPCVSPMIHKLNEK